MKKIILVTITVLMVITAISGCTFQQVDTTPIPVSTIEPMPKPTVESTSEPAEIPEPSPEQADNWIYYDGYPAGLWKIRHDGTGDIKLSDKGASYVQNVGDWVYFVNDYLDLPEDAGPVTPHDPNDDTITHGYAMIYKVSVRGGEEICIYKTEKQASSLANSIEYYSWTITNMVVNNNKIYFWENGNIYKIDVNGENKTMIKPSEVYNNGFGAADNYIYYLGFGGIYKMRDDGTEEINFLDLDSFSNFDFTISNGWLYYKSASMSDYITSMPSYATQKDGLYKICLDGTEDTELTRRGDISSFIVEGDWIYYEIYDYKTGGANIYKMKTDGREDQLFIEGNRYSLTDLTVLQAKGYI